MKRIFFFLTLISVFEILFAQDNGDIELLRQHSYANNQFKDREVVYGFKQTKSKNLVYHVFSSAMFVYQKGLSPVVSRTCAYSPSCSAYSKELIKQYGLFKGVLCTTDRLIRCNRVALAGKGLDYFDIHTGKHLEDVFIYSTKKTKRDTDKDR